MCNQVGMNARHGALIFHLQSRPRTPFLSHGKTLPFSSFLLNSSITWRRENYPDIIGLITARERLGKESSWGCRQGLPDQRVQAAAWLLSRSRLPSDRCSRHRVPSRRLGASDLWWITQELFWEHHPLYPLPLGAGLEHGDG